MWKGHIQTPTQKQAESSRVGPFHFLSVEA